MAGLLRWIAYITVGLGVVVAGAAVFATFGPKALRGGFPENMPISLVGALEWVADAPQALSISDYDRFADCRDPIAVAAIPETLRFKTPVDPDTEILIAGVGDLLIHPSFQAQAVTHDIGFLSLWHNTADLMRAPDVTYANLEGAVARDIAKDGSIVPSASFSDTRVYSGFPLFNYPPTLPRALTQIGVDVVSTANNHALDRSSIGADRTLDAVEQAGLKATGTRRAGDTTAPWHTVTEVKGKRIAWLACTYGTNGIPDRQSQVLFCFREWQKTLSHIKALRADPNIDAIIVTPHWGREYTHEPSTSQTSFGRAAIEAGADAVIGTHPHVIQPLEIHRTQSGHEGLIAYSTSNFVGGYRTLQRRTAMILLVGLAQNDKGRLVAAGVRYIPLRQTFNGDEDTGRITTKVIDRSGAIAAANRAHIIRILPAGLIHPPRLPLSAIGTCPQKPQPIG